MFIFFMRSEYTDLLFGKNISWPFKENHLLAVSATFLKIREKIMIIYSRYIIFHVFIHFQPVFQLDVLLKNN